MKTETFDKINEINMKTGVSFNKIVNQCIEYALKNYEEKSNRMPRSHECGIFYDC